jgi:hypothetical protein
MQFAQVQIETVIPNPQPVLFGNPKRRNGLGIPLLCASTEQKAAPFAQKTSERMTVSICEDDLR